MTKIKFNSIYFDNTIMPSVKKAKSDLVQAEEVACSLDVSSDYDYYKYLLDLDDKIKNCIDDLDKFNNWVNLCKKEFKNVSDEYKEKIDKISNYQIKKHTKLL